MEAVALHAEGVEAAGERQEPGDPWHRAMKGGVEAGDLRQVGETALDRLDQVDLQWQVLRIVGGDPVQLLHEKGGDSFRLRVPHAVDDAMTDRADRGEALPGGEAIEQVVDERTAGRAGEALSLNGAHRAVRRKRFEREGGPGRADALDLPREGPPQRPLGVISRELDARGAAVEGEDGPPETAQVSSIWKIWILLPRVSLQGDLPSLVANYQPVISMQPDGQA